MGLCGSCTVSPLHKQASLFKPCHQPTTFKTSIPVKPEVTIKAQHSTTNKLINNNTSHVGLTYINTELLKNKKERGLLHNIKIKLLCVFQIKSKGS